MSLFLLEKSACMRIRIAYPANEELKTMLNEDQSKVLQAVISATKARGIPPSLPELQVTSPVVV